MAALFSHSTIEAMARVLAMSAPDQPDRAIVYRASGDGPRLFVLPLGSGDPSYGLALMPYIDPGFGIHGLPGPARHQKPFRTIEGAASRLVRMIRTVQPEGPYWLVGWSLAGTLAYEVAKQLTGADESIAFLGLIDTYFRLPRPRLDIEEFAQFIIDDTGDGVRRARSVLAGLPEQADLGTQVRALQAEGVIPADSDTDNMTDLVLEISSTFETIRQYRPTPIPVPIHLFTAQDPDLEPADLPVSPMRGWEQLLPAHQIRVVPVPGRHDHLFRPPHVEAVGTAIADAIRTARSAADPAAQAPGHDPLMTIQRGSPGRPPLICMPGAGDNVAAFTLLAAALGPDQPIFGMQPRGLLRGQVPHTSVEVAAAANLAALMQRFPSGPVHLVGHSFGGWIAFDMALRLQALGRSATSVTLIDTDPPVGPTPPEYLNIDALMSLIELFDMRCPSLALCREDLTGLHASEQLTLLHERLIATGRMPARSTPDDLARIYDVFAACLRTPYAPSGPLDAPLLLVQARDPKFSEEQALARHRELAGQWAAWAPRMTPWTGPGDHLSILQPPHVMQVASRIRALAQPHSPAPPEDRSAGSVQGQFQAHGK
jgi:arthrofactin-type cyclic lipopeptide synthetase C